MISISRNSFPRGITQCTVTVSGSNVYNPIIGTDVTGISLSSDGTNFATYLNLQNGENTVYVRIRNTVQYGVVEEGLAWQYLDDSTGTSVEGAWDITVTGGEPNHYAPMQMVLSPRASTIRYNATMIKGNASLGGSLSGSILDYNYIFEVEKIVQSGTRKQISGSAYATNLVNRLIIYQVPYRFNALVFNIERPTFRTHLSAISQAIGMNIVYYGLDFYPKTNINVALRKNPFSLDFYEVLTGDFASILQNLIGFTSNLPNLQIDLFIEKNTIYLIQRGYQANTRTPANWLANPTITMQKRHTEWGNSSTQQVVPKEISSSDAVDQNQPYSGTITWGSGTWQNSMTYEEGYLVSQVSSSNVGTTTTTYSYTTIDNNKYLSRKEAVTVDSSTQDLISTAVNVYDYATTETELYLHTEEYTVTDEDNEIIEHKMTRYTPAQAGWYGVDVYNLIEDEQISSNLVQGAAGQKANQYLVDTFNKAIKPSGHSQRPITVELNGVAKAAQQYPIANKDSFSGGFGLQQVADALDYYEGKTEEILSGTIVADTHLYNYQDKIVYNGNEYFLVSNNVTQSASGVRQDITAVRYY